MEVNLSSSASVPYENKQSNVGQPAQSKIEQKTLQALRESLEDDESLAKDLPNLIGRIKQLCPNEIQPTPADHFYDTDLIVYKDDYDGPLALNGVKESEYKLIEKLFSNILAGDVFDLDLDQYHKEAFINDIKKLLTRPTGRNLLFKLQKFSQNTNRKIQINFNSSKSWEVTPKDKTFIVYVDYGINPKYVNTVNSLTGDKQPLPWPSFVALGHEFIHIHHDLENTYHHSLFPTIDLTGKTEKEEHFDNLEEQVTITGFSKNPEFKKLEALPNEQEVEEWLAEYKVLNYQELNENALNAQFRFKPRVDHHSVTLEIAKPKDLTDPLSDEFKAYLLLLLKNGLTDQLDELIQHGWDVNSPISFTQSILTPLEIAIGFGKLESLHFLVDHGANIKALNSKHESLGHIAVYAGKYELLSWLIKHGVDPSIKNERGETLYNVALAKNFDGLQLYKLNVMPEELKNNFADHIFQNLYITYDPSNEKKLSYIKLIFDQFLNHLSIEKLKSYSEELSKNIQELLTSPITEKEIMKFKFYLENHEAIKRVQKEREFEMKKQEAFTKQGYYEDENGVVHFP